MSASNRFWKTVLIIIFSVASTTLFAQTVLNQDFESGIGNWWVDNGLWEVGVPTVGPDSAHSGQNCAGTVLDGNYPIGADTRLISPYIILPTLSSGEHINLKFWHWFRMNEHSYYGNDRGYVQISVNGGPWQSLAGPISGYSPVWTQGYVDLSAYADSTIRLAFYFISNNNYEDNGWYIDDVRLVNVTSVEEDNNIYLNKYILSQNYPNPFNPVTQIGFSLPRAGNVRIEIYNSLGQKIATLLDAHKPAGYHELTFDASHLASGVYFYRLETSTGFIQTKKFILLK